MSNFLQQDQIRTTQNPHPYPDRHQSQRDTLPPFLRLLFTLTREKKGGFRIEGGLQSGDLWLQDLLKKYAQARRALRWK
jgi:hypothetical protein